MMQCERFQRRLDDLLDRRVPFAADAALRRHAATCPRCEQILHAHQELLVAVAWMAPSRGLDSPSLSAVDSRRVGRLTWVSALAALLVLSVAGGLLKLGTSTTGPATLASAATTDAGRARLDSDVVASPPTSLPVQQVDHLLMVQQPWIGLRLLSQADWSGPLAAVGAPVPTGLDVASWENRLRDAVAHEITPLQESMTSAFNLLRRTLPSSSPRDKSIDG